MIDVGIRVVRGPNWKWGNQDGGEGYVGTVVEIGRPGSSTSPDKTVVVQWDSGARTNYRIGYQDAYDLRVYDNATTGVRHPQIRCSECVAVIATATDPGSSSTSGGVSNVPATVSSAAVTSTTGGSGYSCPNAVGGGASALSIAHSGGGGALISGGFIRGTRWQCARCSDVNLCSLCYHSDFHDLNHSFYRIEYPLTGSRIAVRVPRRQLSVKVEARGIFSGAKVVRGPDWDWGNQDGGDGRVGRVMDIRGWDNESGRSVANVQWTATGNINVYRLGHKGKVDIKYAESGAARGGFYYRDHLAILGASAEETVNTKGDVKSGEATTPAATLQCPFRVGEKVRVVRTVADLKLLQEGHGGWNDKMSEFVGSVGSVHRITERGDVRVQFDSCPNRWTFHPSALEAAVPLVAGALVRVLENAEEVAAMQRNHGEWTENMRCTLGRVGRVEKVYADGDLRINVAGQLWTFNPLAVLPVKPAQQSGPSSAPGKDKSNQSQQQNASVSGTLPTLSQHNRSGEAGLNMILEKLVELVDTTGPDRLVREAAQGHFDLVREIVLKYPDKVDVKSSGKTALQVAVHQGHEDLVKLLVNRGARLDLADEDGDTALHYACFGNQPVLAEYLLDKGSHMDAVNQGGCTALHVAVNKQHVQCVAVLLARGANPNLCDSYGDTALHDAIGKSSTEIVEMLVAHRGIEVSVRNRRGFDCLHQAALKGNAAATVAILHRFPDAANVRKEDGYAALHLAALNGHTAVAEALVQCGASLEVLNNRGETPLLLAVSQGRLTIAKLLIEHGARLDAVDGDGDGVLHLSLMRAGPSDMDMPDNATLLEPVADQLTLKACDRPDGLPPGLLSAAWLLEQGASLTLRNKQGRAALDLLSQDEPARVALSQLAVQVAKRLETPETVCCVCSDDLTEVTFEPCGHRPCCRDCCLKMRCCINCGEEVKAKRLDDGELLDASQATAAGRLAAATAITQELNSLRVKMQEMECSICMDAPRSVAFMCGHSACTDCAGPLKVCHMCRKPITKKINLF